jgi:hypothetical protein
MIQKHKAVVVFSSCLLGGMALLACSSPDGHRAVTAISTPIPPYVATDQASAQQARSTLQAGEAEAQGLVLTSSAVALERERLALEITRAASTQEYFTVQTQDARVVLALTEQAAATATQDARNWMNTQAAETAQAAASQTAYPLTATPAQATQNAILRANQGAERQAAIEAFTEPIWMAVPLVLMGLCILLAILVYRRLMPIIEKIIKVRGSTIIDASGEIVTILPLEDEFKTLMPKRSVAPALYSLRDTTHPSGMVNDLGVQERVTRSQQLAGIVGLAGHALSESARHQAQARVPQRFDTRLPNSVMRSALRAGMNQQTQPQPTKGYVIMTEDHPSAEKLLSPGEREIIDAEWRDVESE